MPIPSFLSGSASTRYQNHPSGYSVYDTIASVQAGDLLVCVVVNTGGGSADAYRPFGFGLYQSPFANMSIFTRVAVGNATAERTVQTDWFGTWLYYRNSVDISTNPIVSLLFAVRDPWTGGDSRIAGAAGSGLLFPVLDVEAESRAFYITSVAGSDVSPNNPAGMTVHAELTANDESFTHCFQLGSHDHRVAGKSHGFAHSNGAGTESLYALTVRGKAPAVPDDDDFFWAMAEDDESSSAATGAAILLTI